jgi:hypothetical protein
MTLLDDLLTGHWAAFAMLSAFCFVVAATLFVRSRREEQPRPRLWWAALASAALGLLLAPIAGWRYWRIGPGAESHLASLVEHGEIDEAVRFAASVERLTMSDVADVMVAQERMDFRPVLEKDRELRDALFYNGLIFDRQLRADWNVAAEFALAQADPEVKEQLLRRIVLGESWPQEGVAGPVPRAELVLAVAAEAERVGLGEMVANDFIDAMAREAAGRRDGYELAKELAENMGTRSWSVYCDLGREFAAFDREKSKQHFDEAIRRVVAEYRSAPEESATLSKMVFIAGDQSRTLGVDDAVRTIGKAREMLRTYPKSKRVMPLFAEARLWEELDNRDRLDGVLQELEECIEQVTDPERKEMFLKWHQGMVGRRVTER